MYNNPKNSKIQNLTSITDMVKFYGPTKLQLCLKISKEKYFTHLTLYNFIFQIDKKMVNFRFFWNTLNPTLTTNTGLAVNTLTTNTDLAVNTLTTNTDLAINTLTTNKACLFKMRIQITRYSVLYLH